MFTFLEDLEGCGGKLAVPAASHWLNRRNPLPQDCGIGTLPVIFLDAFMTIRFLTTDDVETYRALRLHALQKSSTAFCSSYAEEVELPIRSFADRLQPDGDPGNGIVGAFDENGKLVGMLGFSREKRVKRAHIGSLWSMYVLPEYRGQHVGASLLDRAIAHAKSLGLRQLSLSVNADNTAACGLYYSRGFERFGFERDTIFVDGKYFDEEHLVLYFTEV